LKRGLERAFTERFLPKLKFYFPVQWHSIVRLQSYVKHASHSTRIKPKITLSHNSKSIIN